MKKTQTIMVLSVMFLFAILSSCSKKDSSSNTPTQCNFGTDVSTATSNVLVTYVASNKTSGSITYLTYQGATGPVTVLSPTLPWTDTVTVPTGKPINITAVGSAPSGSSIYLTYTASYTNGIISNTTGCGN